ncbi:hypothetical protein LDENG_00160860 [Lucifuga dentata]|nr:hypothetical protein LDENG_00160860 [Lucifuga dentata]
MANKYVDCKVCLCTFARIAEFKKHLHTKTHQQKMEELFQKDVFKDHVCSTGHFPWIAVMEQLAKHKVRKPIIGLTLLTVCFNPKLETLFYLCHVCEEKCSQKGILFHLFSCEHYSNYYNYTDPNMLSFAWIPSVDMRDTLKPVAMKEVEERGSGQLQMLNMPENLLSALQQKTYSEVMCALSENDKLFKLVQALNPKRMMIQTYQKDCNRKHPLLGTQHLVECVCAEQTDKRHYLCTLCCLTVPNHMIIKHILSFDHIFCYFKAWHPSTLLPKECYMKYTSSFSSMILDFAKQTEAIHRNANTDMKQVSLEPDVFTSVSLSCYAEGLRKLESIRRENKESCLITSITPGDKLVQAVKSSCRLRCQDCNLIFETVLQYVNHVKHLEHKQLLKKIFGAGAVCDGYVQTGKIIKLGLCKYIKENLESNQPIIGVPLIVICHSTQVEVTPIYMCFACEESFPDNCIRQHLNSKKHLIHTLLYQNPWRLPFAWENKLDMEVLKSLALEEQRAKGQNHMTVKVFDIPFWIFNGLTPHYHNVLEKLEQYQHHLRREVPSRDTFRNTKYNSKFPLLGQEFLVKHSACDPWYSSIVWAFLCLLCQRRLSEDECHAHVFSQEHVAKFLESVHPGSLDSSTKNTETLLDLAKQAALIHPVLPIQKLHMTNPIWEPCTYNQAIKILSAVKKKKGRGALVRQIRPKMKLVPTETVKELDSDHERDDSRKKTMLTKGTETERNQESTEKSATAPQISSEAETESDKCSLNEISDSMSDSSACKMVSETETEKRRECVEINSEQEMEKAEMETLSQSENEPERRALFSETASEQIKISGDDKLQVMEGKETEVPEKPTVTNPNYEASERCQHTGTNDGEESGKESNNGSYNPPMEFNNYLCQENEIKQPSSMSEKSQDSCTSEDEREMHTKRQRMASEENASQIETQKIPINGQIKMEVNEVTTTDERESSNSSDMTAKTEVTSEKATLWHYLQKKNREPVVGLNTLFECICDPHEHIYLCESCSMTIPEQRIISHVTGFLHQMNFLVGLQKLPSINGKTRRMRIRCVAATYEHLIGYGEAQIIELDEEMYKIILDEDFQTVIKIVKELLAQQGSGHELPSTLFQDAQSANTSAVPHAQHEIPFETENFQVLDMEIHDSDARPSSDLEIDDSEDSDAQSAPIMTSATTSSCATAGSSFSVATSKLESTISNTHATTTKSVATTSIAAATNTKLTPTTSSCSPPINKSTAISSKLKVFTCASTTTISSSTEATAKLRETTSKAHATAPRSTVPTSNATVTTSKSTVTAKNCTKTTSKLTATSSELAPANSICTITTSNTTSASTSAAVSKGLEKKKEMKSKVTTTTYKTAVTSHTEPTCKNRSTSENSKSTTISTTVMKTVTRVHKTEESATTPQNKSSEKTNADDSSHIHKTDCPTGSSLTPPMSIISGHKASLKETSGSEMRHHQNRFRVGLDQLIIVKCKGKQQVYCQLCSFRLTDSSHLTHINHQYNYVRYKFPEWTASPLETHKLQKEVARLAKWEKNARVSSQRIEVSSDEYELLHHMPVKQALDRLESIIRRHQEKLEEEISSSLTSTEPKRLKLRDSPASPCEASHPNNVNTEHQNPRKLGQKEHALKLSGPNVSPDQPKISQVLPSLSVGERTMNPSNLSLYLKAKGMDVEPVIGLGSVWECRGIAMTPFFLCESCRNKFSIDKICGHVISSEHWFNYVWMLYPQFLYFWSDQDLLEEMKQIILKEIAQLLSNRERFHHIDAQVMMLKPELYQCVEKAPFDEALNILQNLKQEQSDKSSEQVSIFCQAYRTLKQRGARQKAKRHLEEAVQFGDMESKRRVVVPPDVNSFPPNVYSVVSPRAGVSTSKTPRDLHESHYSTTRDNSGLSGPKVSRNTI